MRNLPNARLTGGPSLWVAICIWVCLLLSPRLTAQEPKLRATLLGHTDGVISLSFSPDGSSVASGSRDDSVRVWNLGTGRNTAVLKEERPNLWCNVAVSPDGKMLATGGWFDRVKLWEIDTLSANILLDGKRQCPGTLVVFSPDGKMLASSGICRCEVRLWDVASRKQTALLDGYSHWGVCDMAFAPDGKTLATVGFEDGVKIWETTTGKITATLKLNGDDDEHVRHATFNANGKALLTRSYEVVIEDGRDDLKYRLYLWDVATGKKRALPDALADQFCSSSFSPDGKTLAFGYKNGTIKLWDIVKNKEIITLEAHRGDVLRLVYSADGRMLASGSADKTIKLWEMAMVK